MAGDGARCKHSPGPAFEGVESPLHKAVEGGNALKVAELLEAGADMEAKNAKEATPLHVGAEWGHAAVVEQLLKAGADTNSRNSFGGTPLHTVAGSSGGGGGHAAVADKLLAAGADLHAKARGGFTPLHVAAACGNAVAVLKLLAAGANKDVPDEADSLPMDLAERGKHHALANLLRDYPLHDE